MRDRRAHVRARLVRTMPDRAQAINLVDMGMHTLDYSLPPVWSVDLDVDQIRGLFNTFSEWTAEEAEAAAQAARDLGGRVTEYYVTPSHHAEARRLTTLSALRHGHVDPLIIAANGPPLRQRNSYRPSRLGLTDQDRPHDRQFRQNP